jgi:hypothetical protein
MEREEGFYWVKYQGRWMPAELRHHAWWLTGKDIMRLETTLDAIGPRIAPPQDAE